MSEELNARKVQNGRILELRDHSNAWLQLAVAILTLGTLLFAKCGRGWDEPPPTGPIEARSPANAADLNDVELTVLDVSVLVAQLSQTVTILWILLVVFLLVNSAVLIPAILAVVIRKWHQKPRK